MKKEPLHFEDFQTEELSKKQQKTVQAGDDPGDIDPNKSTGTGGTP